jgi:hypothetical protein
MAKRTRIWIREKKKWFRKVPMTMKMLPRV